MPVPATTGQLRTNINDMEIGDYIPYRWLDSKGDFEIGNIGTAEVPITGITWLSNWNNYFAYMVKVGKGLFVSDRIFAHSGSWENVNNKKWMQGIPWNNGNIIPVMTDNTSPNGTASASSENSNYPAWKAFDGKAEGANATFWESIGLPASIAYEFTEGKTVKSYRIRSFWNSGSVRSWDPKDWTFEGFNEQAGVWDVLDTRKGQAPLTSGTTYSIEGNKRAYKKYRLNITAANSNSNVRIDELQMFDVAGVIRSLTGGVAYADVNGNKTNTDLSFGGWPMNNEWDKYLVNFPADKIQVGKTLDDVFHWKNVYTWTQDTPSTGLNAGNNTCRNIRGSISANKIYFGTTSNSSNAAYGFRPVFEYEEV